MDKELKILTLKDVEKMQELISELEITCPNDKVVWTGAYFALRLLRKLAQERIDDAPITF